MALQIDLSTIKFGTIDSVEGYYVDYLPPADPTEPPCLLPPEPEESFPPIPALPKIEQVCEFTFPDVVAIPPIFNPPNPEIIACEDFTAAVNITTSGNALTNLTHFEVTDQGPLNCGFTLTGNIDVQACTSAGFNIVDDTALTTITVTHPNASTEEFSFNWNAAIESNPWQQDGEGNDLVDIDGNKVPNPAWQCWLHITTAEGDVIAREGWYKTLEYSPEAGEEVWVYYNGTGSQIPLEDCCKTLHLFGGNGAGHIGTGNATISGGCQGITLLEGYETELEVILKREETSEELDRQKVKFKTKIDSGGNVCEKWVRVDVLDGPMTLSIPSGSPVSEEPPTIKNACDSWDQNKDLIHLETNVDTGELELKGSLPRPCFICDDDLQNSDNYKWEFVYNWLALKNMQVDYIEKTTCCKESVVSYLDLCGTELYFYDNNNQYEMALSPSQLTFEKGITTYGSYGASGWTVGQPDGTYTLEISFREMELCDGQKIMVLCSAPYS